MSSRPALTVAAVVAAGGLAFFLYQSYKDRQSNKKDQTSLNTTSTSKSTPPTKHSTPTSTSAPTSSSQPTPPSKTTPTPTTPTPTPTPKLASASTPAPTTSSPSISSMPPPPLMRNMTLLKIETEEKSAPGTNLSVSVTNQTSTPAPIDHIPDVAYLELDIPRGSTIDGAWDVHAAILAVAIQHVQKSLYITINVDPEILSAAEISSLLQRYYHLITTLCNPLRGPLFSSTILLSSPTSPSHPRQRVALVPELQSVLVVAGRDGRVGDLNAKRMALENDLPPVVKQIIQVDAGQSAPTTPVHENHTVKRWNNVVIGGTFDHLHVGHKIMIGVATYVAKRQLVIGLSADELLHNKKYPQYLQSWSHRRSYLISLIYLMSPALLVDIVPLHDVAGPAGDRKELELLVVSEETRDGAVAVNEIRQKNGLSPLEVFEIKLISSPDSIKISSTIIRQHLSDDTRRERVWAAMEWAELTKILYVDQKLGEKWWNKIESLLDEKHRHYHTLSHIAALLRLCETYKSSLRSYDVVRLAIWFHDVIYDPTKKDNEEQSVIMFEQFASEAKLPSWLRSKVIDCINDTKTHTLSWQDDEDEKYFLDMDLAVLGGTQQEYDIYTRGIEKEYNHLDRTIYREGRINVLTSLLEKDRLYATTDFYDRYEKLARFNIAREIEQLKHAV